MAKNPLPKDLKFVGSYVYFKTGEYVDGKQVLKPMPPVGSPDFGMALANMLAVKTKRSNRVKLITVAELVHAYEKSDGFSKLAKSTRETYGFYITRIVEEFLDPKRGSWPVVKIERPDIRELIEPLGYGAQKMQLAVIRAMFTFGRRHDKLPTDFDPTADMKIEHTADEHKPWPDSLIETMLQGKMRLPVALLYYTGQRIGAVVRMRWSDIKDGEIYVPPHKKTPALWIPLHSRLQSILAEYPKGLTTIICNPNGKSVTTDALRQRIMKFSGEYVPHGLRKNAVGTLLEVGCSVGQIHGITAQSLKMIEHYARNYNQRKAARSAMDKWEAN